MFSSWGTFIVLIATAALHESKTTGGRHSVRKFPNEFKFGAATSSYQVEGAWDENGKSESIWDRLTHRVPSPVADGSNGDIAANSYHQIERDVEMMRELGLDFYRFSLSWTRILPTSFPDQINEPGVQYYNNLINEMLKYNIEPMITLYHWDLPQKLQDLGGWTNPNMVDWFLDYARVAFEQFGDRVKYWITINEPKEICYAGYGGGTLAPAYQYSGVADYMCSKNLLVAHAKVYHVYDKEFRPSQGGEIFITLSAQWTEPESEEHIDPSRETNLFEWGLYAHPIFSEAGDFPSIVKERVAAKSAAQGFPRSRLPEFTPEEVEFIKGTSDYFGLNHYSTNLAYRNESTYGYHKSPSFYDDIDAVIYQKDEWVSSIAGATTLVRSVPWGFYKLLTDIKQTYNNPKVIITENGFATHGGLEDTDRMAYYRDYLDAMLDAIQDGSNIVAYAAWSLMDNFEWSFGYTQCYGLYEVDYESPLRTRSPRLSAFVYKEILRTRQLDFHFDPDTNVMNIDEGH